MTISADETVELELKDYYEYKVFTGKLIKSQISQNQVKQLVSEFEKIDFYSLKSTFENEQINKDCPETSDDGVTLSFP